MLAAAARGRVPALARAMGDCVLAFEGVAYKAEWGAKALLTEGPSGALS